MGVIGFYVIHKGNRWVKLKNSKIRNGFKLGEFAFTKKPFYHPIYKKRK
jgi:ribosomal protein S19